MPASKRVSQRERKQKQGQEQRQKPGARAKAKRKRKETTELTWAREELLSRLQLLEAQLSELEREGKRLKEKLRTLYPQGAVIAKYVRCGKPNCHCAKPGDPSHGPYFYRVYRQGGKVRTEYLSTKPPPSPEGAEEGEGATPVSRLEYSRLQRQLKAIRRERERIFKQVSKALAVLRSAQT